MFSSCDGKSEQADSVNLLPFQYLEMRYNSRIPRLFGAGLGIFTQVWDFITSSRKQMCHCEMGNKITLHGSDVEMCIHQKGSEMWNSTLFLLSKRRIDQWHALSIRTRKKLWRRSFPDVHSWHGLLCAVVSARGRHWVSGLVVHDSVWSQRCCLHHSGEWPFCRWLIF